MSWPVRLGYFSVSLQFFKVTWWKKSTFSNKTVKIAWKDCDWTTFRFFDFLKDRYFETKIKYWLKASLSSFAHILHFLLYYFNGVSSHPLPLYTKVMTSLHDKDITCCCGGKCNKRHIIQLKHPWHSTYITARKSDWFTCVL